ncbi:universal stress protein [Parabacteroides sp. Marseille-P3160]|uniref:universal stress protein n=1 Tax=Parabacteroides sp. Marseille-P3160 TaxID=1917887 RepID=UPI0009BA74FA|nr:universal stress protein [Parabacteroides sp. Marseille-P3160]
MEEKLVTLAIYTFEKAQILKTILESEGIEVYIHNVNQIQPVISAGVRVRIKESDLPHALRVLEDSKWLSDENVVSAKSKEKENPKRILIPIDFSDYSMKACEIGFNYAKEVGAEVMLLHAYFSPYFPSAMPLVNVDYDIQSKESVTNILARVKKEMLQICEQINNKMASGELPKIKYDTILREGLPEEEVIEYSEEYNPMLIVMGTRGKSQKDIDMIGSVTGEVIEMSKKPILAIPENTSFKNLANVNHLAFATSMNQRDLVVFDEFVELIKPYKHLQIHIFNISTTRNEWNEIRLAGISEYFKKQYPELNISHTVLDDGDLLLAVEKFVRDKNIDLIALSTYKRSLFARMFNPSKARKMLFHTNTALLTIHH